LEDIVNPLLWSFVLLSLAVVFIALEVFLPSGGMLAFLACCSMIAAIVVGFMHGFRPGMTVTLATLVVLPLSVGLALKIWPKTPIGKRMVCVPPEGDEQVLPVAQLKQRETLVGRVGTATTKMLPSGEVEIAGEIFDAVTAGMAVEPGQVVEVIDVRANRIVVKPTSRQLSPNDDPLEQPLEDFGFDSIQGV
jgi:membrane-bound ClpP family serine protease